MRLLIALGLLLFDGTTPRWHNRYNPFFHMAAHFPGTPPLQSPDTTTGYRLSRIFADRDSTRDTLALMISLSGGGTRAAALAYGVLSELQSWQAASNHESLLDHARLVSGVSGGGVAAAYWAAHGTSALLSRFPQDFLEWDLQGDLLRMSSETIRKVMSPYYGRSDYAAELWASHLFSRDDKALTFADFAQPFGYPFFILDASDVSTGAQFSFVQEQFDAICGDLGQFPVARAVASISAFPGLLSPVVLQSHRYPDSPHGVESCPWPYQTPDWVERLAKDSLGGLDAYWAQSILAATEDVSMSYLHLIDGGVADNLGLRPIILALSDDKVPWSFARRLDSGRIKTLGVIVVNAATQTPETIGESEKDLSIVGELARIAGTPLDRFTGENLARIREVTRDLRQLHQNAVFEAEVAFANDFPAERHFLNSLPTSFSLSREQTARLIEAGGRLLRCDPGFQQLVRKLGLSRVPSVQLICPSPPAHPVVR